MIDPDVVALITTAVAAGTAYAISHNWVSVKKLDQTWVEANRVVLAAEELFSPGQGEVKFKWSIQQLCAKLGIDENEAHIVISAVVAGLRQSGVKPPKMQEYTIHETIGDPGPPPLEVV